MRHNARMAVMALLAGAAACSDEPTSNDAMVVVTAVSPSNGSVVATTAVVSVTFSHGMLQGMEMLVVLHEGSVTGPVVAGTPVWSADRRVFTFTPASPLKPGTTYVLHLGPGLRAANGVGLNHGACGTLGGTSVGPGMMGAGGMGPGMMGPGWQVANGTYGMIFTFRTS